MAWRQVPWLTISRKEIPTHQFRLFSVLKSAPPKDPDNFEGVYARSSGQRDHRAMAFARLRNCRDPTEVEELLNRVRPFRSPREYTLAISAYGRLRQPHKALALFAEIEEPDTISYGAALFACEREGLWMQAVDLLDRMRSNGPEPDIIAYQTAISACKRAGEWQKALEIMNGMHIEPDVHIVNAVIAACARRGLHIKAKELLNDMRARGHPKPNVVTYNTVIAACARGRRSADAVELLEQMREYELEPDLISYNSVILALCRSNPDGVEQAKQLAQDMPFEPDEVTHATLIAASDPSSALDIFEDAEKHTVKIYNALLTSLNRAGHHEEVLNVFKKIPEPDLKTYLHALNASAKLARDGEALELLKSAPLRENRKPRPAVLIAMEACLAAGNVTSADDLALSHFLTRNTTFLDLRGVDHNVAERLIVLAVSRIEADRLVVQCDKSGRRGLSFNKGHLTSITEKIDKADHLNVIDHPNSDRMTIVILPSPASAPHTEAASTDNDAQPTTHATTDDDDVSTKVSVDNTDPARVEAPLDEEEASSLSGAASGSIGSAVEDVASGPVSADTLESSSGEALTTPNVAVATDAKM